MNLVDMKTRFETKDVVEVQAEIAKLEIMEESMTKEEPKIEILNIQV